MSTISFDTHTFVKHLTQAGMPIAQAEVLADSQARLIDDKLATKHDLNELGSGLTRDIKELEARLTRDIKELETKLSHDVKELDTRLKELEIKLTRDMNELALRLTIRLGSMLVIAVGVVATLVKLL